MNNPIPDRARLDERVAAGLGPRPSTTSRVREAPSRAAGAVLEVLERLEAPATVTDVAESTGQHPNTVREHLDALVAAQLATREARAATGRGRPAWLYAVVPAPAAGAPEYAGLATALAMQLAATSTDPRREAATAGEAWGRRLARGRLPEHRGAKGARRAVVSLLAHLGFEPTTDDRATTTRLTTCPLLQAAVDQPDVVCSVHVGIVRGALDTWGAHDEPAALVPFAEPGACLLHLGRAAAGRAATGRAPAGHAPAGHAPAGRAGWSTDGARP